MITFKAQYIRPVNILKRGIDKKYYPYEASFIQLNPKIERDVVALNEANINWDCGETFASDIALHMNEIWRGKPNKKERNFYALTKSSASLKNLMKDDFLGFIEVSKLDSNTQEIEYIQVNPAYLNSPKGRDFVKIGKGLLDSIKLLFKEKNIELYSNSTAINFYKQNGFLPKNEFGRLFLCR